MQSYTLTLGMLVSMVAAAFAGYAFPVEGENIAIDKFKTVNPSQEVDETNFLVDLSGRYSRCGLRRGNGRLSVVERTPEGAAIEGLVERVSSRSSDSASLTNDIQRTLSEWVRTEPYRSQIQKANRHGCSIEPDCQGPRGEGQAVIVCLFSSV